MTPEQWAELRLRPVSSNGADLYHWFKRGLFRSFRTDGHAVYAQRFSTEFVVGHRPDPEEAAALVVLLTLANPGC